MAGEPQLPDDVLRRVAYVSVCRQGHAEQLVCQYAKRVCQRHVHRAHAGSDYHADDKRRDERTDEHAIGGRFLKHVPPSRGLDGDSSRCLGIALVKTAKLSIAYFSRVAYGILLSTWTNPASIHREPNHLWLEERGEDGRRRRWRKGPLVSRSDIHPDPRDLRREYTQRPFSVFAVSRQVKLPGERGPLLDHPLGDDLSGERKGLSAFAGRRGNAGRAGCRATRLPASAP